MRMGKAGMFSFAARLLALSLFAGGALSTFGRMSRPAGSSSNGGRQAFAFNVHKVHLQRVRQARGWAV